MFKKIILITGIMVSSNMAFATTPYVGGSLGVANVGGYTPIAGVGQVFGGFGDTFGASNIIYLGGELNVSASHYKNYGTAYGVGASFIPGIMLTQNTMAYARLGVESSRYHDDHVKVYGVGTQLGLGLQTSLSNNWDVRGEVDAGRQLNVGLVYKFN